MLRQVISGVGTVIALGCTVVVGSSVAWSNFVRPDTRAYATRAAFDQVFADVAAMPSAMNTPATRERLRDIGWTHLNVRLASR